MVERWQADRQRIRLALSSDADEPGAGGEGQGRQQRRGGRHLGSGEPVSTTIQRGPKRLLNLLATSQIFRTSSVEILLPNGASMPANRFFVTFENANPDIHSGHYHGFWGIPLRSSPWSADGSVYLNTAEGRDPRRIAVNVPQALRQRVRDRFRVEGMRDLVGKYVLVFGEPYVTAGGQFTLYVRNHAHMAVLDPRDLIGQLR